jgi:hypothetical protein
LCVDFLLDGFDTPPLAKGVSFYGRKAVSKIGQKPVIRQRMFSIWGMLTT